MSAPPPPPSPRHPHDSVTIECAFATAVAPTERVMQTAVMFGLGIDETRRLRIVPRAAIPLPRGGVVFITGPSGGGKSTVLRLIANALPRIHRAAHWLGTAADPRMRGAASVNVRCDGSLVDRYPAEPLAATLKRLALVGLGDAFVMLRRPRELSDGQRARLAVADLIARVESAPSPSAVMLADEFGAALDRETARTVARNLARWVRDTPHTLVIATTHDDLLEALAPEVLVWKGLGEAIEVHTR